VTLPLFLLQQYPELNTRINTLMAKCQSNMHFINRLIDSYKPLLYKKIPLENTIKAQNKQI